MGSVFLAFHSKEIHAVLQISKVFNLLSLHLEIQELKKFRSQWICIVQICFYIHLLSIYFSPPVNLTSKKKGTSLLCWVSARCYWNFLRVSFLMTVSPLKRTVSFMAYQSKDFTALFWHIYLFKYHRTLEVCAPAAALQFKTEPLSS